MQLLKNTIRYFLKLFKWLIIIFISFILLLWVLVFIADTFFDRAAEKDSCANYGGAWNHTLDVNMHLMIREVKNSQLFN